MGTYSLEKNEVSDEEDLKRWIYEEYRFNWLKKKDVRLSDLFDKVSEWKNSNSQLSVEEYFYENGIFGDIYMTYEEFIEKSYFDAAFIKSFTSEKQFEAYMKDTNAAYIPNTMQLEVRYGTLTVKELPCRDGISVIFDLYEDSEEKEIFRAEEAEIEGRYQLRYYCPQRTSDSNIQLQLPEEYTFELFQLLNSEKSRCEKDNKARMEFLDAVMSQLEPVALKIIEENY